MTQKITCRTCGTLTRPYDSVPRVFREKGRKTTWIRIKRFKCPFCGSVRRILPESLFPHKHYDSEIIKGVIEGFIGPDTYGYEDYPCEMTMFRWKEEFTH